MIALRWLPGGYNIDIRLVGWLGSVCQCFINMWKFMLAFIKNMSELGEGGGGNTLNNVFEVNVG